MRIKFYVFVLMFLWTTPFSLAQFDNISGDKIIDLTYPFDSLTIFWPTEKGFQLEVEFRGMNPKGYFYSANKFCTAEHGGTHMDAPIHFYKGKQSVDEIPIENLIGRGIVIDVSEKCSADRDYLIMTEDFKNWEKENGEIPANSIILLKTGFGKYWPDRNKYMGTDERGLDAVAKLHFPGLHPDAAEWLVTKRKIKAVGIESPSIDYGQSKLFKTHVYLTEHEIPILENVAYLEKLPLKGFTIIALPMKIRGGSGGPTRIIALLD
ncbi:MAG: cyclase family protein [Ignavibacteria bacterium]|jgi:kynurenine formamidase